MTVLVSKGIQVLIVLVMLAIIRAVSVAEYDSG